MLRTVLVIGTATLAIGCGKKIDSAKAERLLKEKLGIGKDVKVTCPSDLAIEPKAKFSCDVADTPAFRVDFVIEDGEGNVTWELQPGAYDTKRTLDVEQKKLKEQEEKAKGKDVAEKENKALKFACPRRVVVVNKLGDTAVCDATFGDQKGKVTFTYGQPWTWAITWN